MHEIKFGLHIGNIMIYLKFSTWGGHGAPTPRKLKFLKWLSSGPAQYKIILWYKLSFLWKFQQEWPTFRGVLGSSGILWIPRQLHSLNLHFGLDMNFCNAPNAPKISSLIIRICMKLNLGFILAILWYIWNFQPEGVMGPPHPGNWNS